MRLPGLGRRLVAGLLLIPPCVRLVSCGPAVDVALRASWNGAPFLLELLETAAEESATSYFTLLDRIAAGGFASDGSDKHLYDEFLRVAQEDGFLVRPEELASFNFALSIHAAAPRIEAHYHYYKNSLEPLMGRAYEPGCRVWLQWGDKQVCGTGGDLKDMLRSSEKQRNDQRKLQFDRVLERQDGGPAAILYADIEAPEFKEFHSILKDYAEQGLLTYRVRYKPLDNRKHRPVILSGYGVELALKKTDYIVMDDRGVPGEGEVKDRDGDKAPLGGLDDQETQDITPLHPKDIASLGVMSASFVMKSEDPLKTLLKLLQDFPKHASAVTASEVVAEVADELRDNWESLLGPGRNGLWINGVQLEDSQVNAFALLEHLRRERQIVNKLGNLGVNPREAIQLLSHEILANSKQEEAPQRFDYRDDIEGGKTIVWLNDLEHDLRYRDWSPSVAALLRRVYPGQLHQLRKNLHHLVIPINLTSIDDLSLVTDQLRLFVDRKIGIRFGLVPLTGTPEAIVQAKVFYYLAENFGIPTVLRYLELSGESNQFSAPDPKIFEEIINKAELQEGQVALSLEEVLSSETLLDRVQAATSWGNRLGAHSTIPPVFINGLYLPRDEAWLQQMSAKLQMDVQLTQKAVYEDVVDDNTDLGLFLLGKAATRRNAHIFSEDEDSVNNIDVAKILGEHAQLFEQLPSVSSDKPDKLLESTIWVIGDFDQEGGYRLLQGATELQKSASAVNLVLINNSGPESQPPPALSTLLHQLYQARFFTSPERLRKLLEEVSPLKEGFGTQEIGTLLQVHVPDVKAASWQFPDHIESANFWKGSQRLPMAIGFMPGQRGLVINGRVVGPIPADEDFSVDDFELLLDHEQKRSILPALKAAEDIGVLDNLTGPQASACLTNLLVLANTPGESATIFQAPPAARTDAFNRLWKDNHVSITSGDKDTAIFQVVASIDPVSELAQKWVSLLKVLSEMKSVYLKIYLNPQRMISEIPIKRFYRHVLDAAPSFDEFGNLVNPRARFENIPEVPLLSLSMDVPPSWLVTPKGSPYDLDNLKIQSLKDRLKGKDIEALYELRSILIEGHSMDTATGGAPKGAQLVLSTEKDPHFADTIIMANLGYFQFKANPGYYKMELKEGRSKEIFHIDSTGAKGLQQGKQPESDGDSEIALLSFQGATLFPKLSRNPGMEQEDVLGEPNKMQNVGNLASKILMGAEDLLARVGFRAHRTDVKPQAEINIFSVASGHLYERFLNIMMLSVMKHTDKSVKFWFIENFLSPSFKDFIPAMAKEYGFDYELVTYKWPHWLRAQKEKQREIWGYKILFLDVLFPLDLDKVIFVDADQIVRTDMKELVDLDLHGAPYGFTPMCDSREEIEGFRFWKQGYWKNFLQGLPYHISALYVVDLKRFRRIAAGDRLRQQYHQLSADPQSLSNLDQDLPNHMQGMLPIHSLPQDWLWCETWCSDESLKTAKTIDLCNNPMTKEPKLDRARRQVPEWTAYDEEVAELARRVTAKKDGEVRDGEEIKDEL